MYLMRRVALKRVAANCIYCEYRITSRCFQSPEVIEQVEVMHAV